MKKLIVGMLIFFTLLFIMPIVAFAAEGPIADAIGMLMEGYVFPILTAALLTLFTIALHRLSAKFKIDILLNNETVLTEWAKQAIAFAEEKAAQRIKAGAKDLTTGSDKLDIAVRELIFRAPKLLPGEARKLVEVTLGRVIGIGASGKTAVL